MRRAFTLIELLVVIAVISVLAAIIFPVFSKAREKARQTSCLTNQRQLAASILMYSQDHEGILPSSADVWQEVVVDRNILMCPVKGKQTANAYVYNNMAAEMCDSDIDDPTKLVLTADGQHAATTSPITYDHIAYSDSDLDLRHYRKALASFADGHVAPIDSIPILLPRFIDVVIWFRADRSVKHRSAVQMTDRWIDQSNNKYEAIPLDYDHAPILEDSVPSLGGKPAVRFAPPVSHPNILVTPDISSFFTREECTMFIVFHPTGNNDQYEYTVFDQSNGPEEQGTRVRGSNNVGAIPFLRAPSNVTPSVSLSASPSAIEAGQSSTLTWSSTDAASVDSSNFGASSLNGSVTVSPTSTTEYTITVRNGNKKATAKATVTVNAPQPNNKPTVTLSASPTTVDLGQTVTLTWSSTNATSVDSSNFGASGVSGSTTLKPTATTTYTITVANGNKTASASVTVTVNTPPVDADRFSGNVAWFRKAAAVNYPPNNVTYNTPTLWALVSSPSEYRIYERGSLTTWAAYAGGSDWLTPQQLYLGGSPKGTNANLRSFDGYIGEVIIYNKALDQDQRQYIEQYLLYKYGLTPQL
jgi:prepilin-type N-terminal cleavage/methylation domain-containing protein/prepilin-type processing-associated H-X9-DG protein